MADDPKFLRELRDVSEAPWPIDSDARFIVGTVKGLPSENRESFIADLDTIFDYIFSHDIDVSGNWTFLKALKLSSVTITDNAVGGSSCKIWPTGSITIQKTDSPGDYLMWIDSSGRSFFTSFKIRPVVSGEIRSSIDENGDAFFKSLEVKTLSSGETQATVDENGNADFKSVKTVSVEATNNAVGGSSCKIWPTGSVTIQNLDAPNDYLMWIDSNGGCFFTSFKIRPVRDGEIRAQIDTNGNSFFKSLRIQTLSTGDVLAYVLENGDALFQSTTTKLLQTIDDNDEVTSETTKDGFSTVRSLSIKRKSDQAITATIDEDGNANFDATAKAADPVDDNDLTTKQWVIENNKKIYSFPPFPYPYSPTLDEIKNKSIIINSFPQDIVLPELSTDNEFFTFNIGILNKTSATDFYISSPPPRNQSLFFDGILYSPGWNMITSSNYAFLSLIPMYTGSGNSACVWIANAVAGSWACNVG